MRRRGHIHRQGRNSWAIVICLGRDPKTGKEKHKWHTVRGAKKDADLAVQEFLERWLRDVG